MNKTLPLVFYVHGFSETATGGPGSSSQDIKEGKLLSSYWHHLLT
jgi:hypothetical protein